MNILFGNCGNNHLSLIQWAIEVQLNDRVVVYVDTGWASVHWQQHVKQVDVLLQQHKIQSVVLKPSYDFSKMVEDRQQFPSKKFQWCAGFLKGLPLLEWLDECDPCCEATILLGSRRIDSALRGDLTAVIESSPHYGDRRVEHPLLAYDDKQQYAAIKALGLDPLSHRSDECFPCIHAVSKTFQRAGKQDWQRMTKLEKQTGLSMFDQSAKQLQQKTLDMSRQETIVDTVANLDMGCGSPYACGE